MLREERRGSPPRESAVSAIGHAGVASVANDTHRHEYSEHSEEGTRTWFFRMSGMITASTVLRL